MSETIKSLIERYCAWGVTYGTLLDQYTEVALAHWNDESAWEVPAGPPPYRFGSFRKTRPTATTDETNAAIIRLFSLTEASTKAKELESEVQKMEARQRVPNLFPSTIETTQTCGNEQETYQALLEVKMHLSLALWLCSYFQGIPRYDVFWNDVTRGIGRLGTYPEGAFYYKLSGDIFRYERRDQDKKVEAQKAAYEKDGKLTFDWQNEGILVIAFTPLLLVPETVEVPVIPPAFTSEASGISHFQSRVRLFYHRVSRLAARYALLQMRAYILCGYPIRYAVSRSSASVTLFNYFLAKGKNEYPNFDALFSRIKEYNKAQSPNRPSVEQEIKEINLMLEAVSRRQLNRFLVRENNAPLPLAWQQIEAFGKDAFDRRGLTSFVLGTRDGVSSNRPNLPSREGRPGGKAVCHWASGSLLATDRRKICEFWSNPNLPPLARMNLIQTPDPQNSWCSVKSRIMPPSVVAPLTQAFRMEQFLEEARNNAVAVEDLRVFGDFVLVAPPANSSAFAPEIAPKQSQIASGV